MTLVYNIKVYRIKQSIQPVRHREVVKQFNLCKKELRVRKQLILGQSVEVHSPMVFGVVKTYIILPTYMMEGLSSEELYFIFLHELTHYKKKDILINYVVCFFQIIYWFNPILYWAFKDMRVDREIACDAAVLQRIDPARYIDYGKMIINCAEQLSEMTSFMLVTGIGASKKQIKKRIENIIAFKHETKSVRIKSMFIFMLTGIMTWTQVLAVSTMTADQTQYDFQENQVSYEDLSEYFGEMNDSFVLYDLQADQYHIYNEQKSVKKVSPNSAYKIYSTLFALESGVITPDTVMNDIGFYSKVGKPYPRCWHYTNNGYGHGNVDVERALEVSCNYYFYDIPYRLGLKYGAPYGAADVLTNYVEMFSLDQKTGIELEEISPNVSSPQHEVYNQVIKALNRLRNISLDNKEGLLKKVSEYLNTGFYPSGSQSAATLEDKIHYLSAASLKKTIDNELRNVLEEDLEVIFDKVRNDLEEGLAEDITKPARQVVSEVFGGDENISLKTRSKRALANELMNHIEAGTRKIIAKAVGKIPKSMVVKAYDEVYRTLYARYSEDEDMKELCQELEQRIAVIEAGGFETIEELTDQILMRIIYVYLDEFFEDIDMEWTMAINIRTAIGQGKNAFTPVQMARYIAGLANGKEVYDLKVVNGIYDHKEVDAYYDTPVKLFNTLDIKASMLKSVYEGMKAVTHGTEGSARTSFADFPMQVAGKTGTAEGGRYEDSWFVGFAPYEQPEIAIVTSMYEADGLGSYNT